MMSLTHRERQVLQALVDGGGTLQGAADQLKLSPNTIRVHLTSCAHKLGTLNEGRLATIVAARKARLITID